MQHRSMGSMAPASAWPSLTAESQLIRDLNNASGVSRVVYSQSFVAGDTTTPDKYGHGTHVAGLIGGTGASSGTANGYAATYAGMAPNVNLINLRVLDQNGSGTDSQVIAAIEEAITLQSTYNIRVINMSLGRPVFESYTLDPVDQAVEAAWKAGIVVVAAAGNNGRYATDGRLRHHRRSGQRSRRHYGGSDHD